ncbi:Peptidyl-prolyl cis-trans isomerase [Naganishia friedmannii]|uniref:Peptidyl-prolyl cis-trans isomerase n=1 Tax=Naganishia friedmannii TaxID=89922 RepID=A0ACC2VC03_9TREE|nr:Peptidyl-prolyl cis-trans isomerase [Naganishia friedmannii]
MKSDENKIRTLSPGLALAFGGEPGDTNNFVDYVERNLRLYQIRNNTELLPAPASAFIRKELANSIRSRSPYAVNLLLGGYDKVHSEAHLYSIDLYGTKAILPYAAQGLGIYVALSTMDKYWYPEITREEAEELLRKCVAEVKLRLAYQFTFNAVVIDKDGVKDLPLL